MLSRREFTAGLSLSGVTARAGGADSQVRVGLIGCGNRGSYIASLAGRDARVRLTALCDVVPERLDAAATKLPAKSPKLYKDYRDLLASDVEAVMIGTPVFLHPEHFEAAVAAGKHIYCEKPVGVDVAGCLRVKRAAAKADPKKNIVIGFQARYGPGYLMAQQWLREGAIGLIKLARSNWIASSIGRRARAPVPPEQEKLRYWISWREYSGDFIVEQNCHGIDILNWFLGGTPVKAVGTGGRIVRTYGDCLDNINVTFTYPSGVNAVLTGTQIGPNGYRKVSEEFLGSSGVIETERQSATLFRNPNDVRTEKIERNISEHSVEEFVRRVVENQPENNAARAADSTLTAILGRMAVDRRREVTWDEMVRGG